MSSDTIVALATPPGTAALAVIRLSGPRAHAIAAALAGRTAALPIQRAIHATLRDTSGAVLDDVVLTAWQAPRSYTGEDVVEFSCHGNPLIVEAILSACLAHGARSAGPGEFTQRAFLNERIDLTQAEAVMDLIHASSARALQAARRLQSGALGRAVTRLREELLQTLAHLEAYIDFPEEDISPDTGHAITRRIDHLQEGIQALLATAPEGRRLREGYTVVLTGAPNAGKSSLLNALLQRDRAIVSPLPGTTRDTIEEAITLAGMTVRLIDTAGLRDPSDPLESLGIARTRQALATADLILHLADPAAPTPPEPATAPILKVWTKADLHPTFIPDPSSSLCVSSLTGAGLEALKDAIIQTLKLNESSLGHESAAINTRHEALLRQALEALERARAAHTASGPPEFTSADLRHALDALGQIVGEATNEDILDRLFRSFCIGK
jgi:tRNA modification GTPase